MFFSAYKWCILILVYSSLCSSQNSLNLLNNNSTYDAAIQNYSKSGDLLNISVFHNDLFEDDLINLNDDDGNKENLVASEEYLRGDNSSVLPTKPPVNVDWEEVIDKFSNSSFPKPLNNNSETVTEENDFDNTDKPIIIDEAIACHNECLSQLNNMTFKTIPEDLFVEEGSSITLECSLPLSESSTAKLYWLFQAVNPPSAQCSIIREKTLPLCDHFASKEHFVDDNYTAEYLKEVLILNQLTKEDSGYYICMAEVSCCSNTHIMDHTLQTKSPVVVYYEDYQIELIILSSVLVCLFIIVIVGTFYQHRRREKYIHDHFQTYKTHVIDDVLHVPILQRRESFEESEEEKEEEEEWEEDLSP